MHARWPFLTLFLTIFGSLQPGIAHGDELSELKITRPYIYKITGGREVSYLFGSYHFGFSIGQLPQWILALHDQTQVHWYELKLGPKKAVEEFSKSRQMHFSPESTVSELKKLANGRRNDGKTTARMILYGVPKVLAPYLIEDVPENRRDACTYATIAELIFARPYQGLDHELLIRSYGNQKRVVGLENEHIRVAADKACKVEGICRINDYSVWDMLQAREYLSNVLARYAEGNLKPRTSCSLEYRNQVWARSLGKALQKSSHFITVGADHRTGLIPLLEAQGYKVERIENAAQAGL